MIKQIKMKHGEYAVNYSPEIAIKVLDKILDWMQEKEHGSSYSGESLFQNDECQIDAPCLIANIVDDILEPKRIGREDDDY